VIAGPTTVEESARLPRSGEVLGQLWWTLTFDGQTGAFSLRNGSATDSRPADCNLKEARVVQRLLHPPCSRCLAVRSPSEGPALTRSLLSVGFENVALLSHRCGGGQSGFRPSQHQYWHVWIGGYNEPAAIPYSESRMAMAFRYFRTRQGRGRHAHRDAVWLLDRSDRIANS